MIRKVRKQSLRKQDTKIQTVTDIVETPDGDPLTLDFVIYTSRAELGVYAQAAQASLKEIGINVKPEYSKL